jgi:hypothetical protein
VAAVTVIAQRDDVIRLLQGPAGIAGMVHLQPLCGCAEGRREVQPGRMLWPVERANDARRDRLVDRRERLHRSFGTPLPQSLERFPLSTAPVPTIVREIVDQHVVCGSLSGFKRVVEQREVLGELPPITANEPVTADGRMRRHAA